MSMMGKALQCRGDRSAATKRLEKRRAARLRRRREKADPENAPRQVKELITGYST